MNRYGVGGLFAAPFNCPWLKPNKKARRPKASRAKIRKLVANLVAGVPNCSMGGVTARECFRVARGIFVLVTLAIPAIRGARRYLAMDCWCAST